MLEHVLQPIESDALQVYAVWEPILQTDDRRAANKATTFLPDSRVRHYWVDTPAVGELFQPAIDLRTEPAWDVYLLYAPGVGWESSAPPRPSSFMHQLGGRLPDEHRLDGETLQARVRELLPK